MGATAKERHKIVIQASDNDQAKWELALNNAKNLQDDVGATHVDIEIVAYGPGIGAAGRERCSWQFDTTGHSRGGGKPSLNLLCPAR